ncbi:mechanosensitive ion channel family protein [Stappia indica]|uniref:mechanosensitive ion channel family protein n=1 Tax=Stappia indica TaxID=538381 RepID=UPI001CD33D86|nr:mechanosensitive ion channel domain-containing protein [Stappia indica]MCA1299000.1 mechanosensitive ion channel family protein [Stappia indica]
MPAPSMLPGGGEQMKLMFQVRDALEQTLRSAENFSELSTSVLLSQSPDGTLGWLTTVVLVLVLSAAIGLAALHLCERWASARFLRLYDPEPQHRAGKIGYLLSRALSMGLGVAAFALVSVLIALLLVSGHTPSRISVFAGLEALLVFLLLRIVFLNVLAPDRSAHRMVAMGDRDAHGLYRWLMGVSFITFAAMGVCNWMAAMGLEASAHKLALIGTVTVSCLLLAVVIVLYRRPLGRLLVGDPQAEASVIGWRRVLALLWLPLVLVYFLAALAISVVRVLLDQPSALGLVAAPVMAALLGSVLYGVLVLLIDRWLLPRLDTEKARQKFEAEVARATETALGAEDAQAEATEAQAQAEALDAENARSPYRHLLDHGAAILSIAVAVGFLLIRWGVPLADDRFLVANLFEISLVIFASYMAYHAVAITIDRQIARETGNGNGKPGEDTGEIGGKGETRLATLLPLFRNFLLISIVAIAAMLALSELGVNIAPLFAGAGVVGLAVGFGAQTLIRDIFSGAFFLFDDAFRKGEYIDIGSVKGTVEKISIRSMQLRHHNGPLNTVPFGEIQFVKNFSRDWAVMKLAFRVTYDTDVERMRKLIKKFGQELLEHPEYGPKFLEPVKSQGVTALEDSAMIVRVKFMTRPGQQFELRKVVYAGIRDLCEREGIHFAHREVTVRVSQDPDDPRQFSEEEKKAIGGAALPAIEQQQAAGQASAASNDGR